MKNNKGFTLVEVIISIAVLSVLCVIFLQLFVKASDISDRAHELDESVTLTNSTMEIVKSIGSINELENVKYLNEFSIDIKEDEIIMLKNYNEAFQYESEIGVYQMFITLKPKQAIENSLIQLYDIKCEVFKVEDKNVLYSATSQIILE